MRRFLMAVGAMTLTVSCGNGQQNTTNLEGVDSAGQGELAAVAEVKSSYKDAIWFVGCDAADRPPAALPGQIVISGNSFNSVRENFTGTKISFQGRVCPPANYPRDVVFMIDVSASMGFPDADPLVSGRCNRLNQLESMIAGLPAGSKFGVVAYEETISAASTNLYDTKAALYNELTANGAKPIAGIICEWRNLGFLDVGMGKAKELLAKGRGSQVQKELVIMTDGDNLVVPSNTHLMNGLAIVDNLKSTGVVVGGGSPIKVQIAGLCVAPRSVDKYLRLAASLDRAGTAMVDVILQSSSINTRLNGLSLGVLDTAKIAYGPIGSTAEVLLDLKPSLAGDYSFHIDTGAFALDRDQTGYNLRMNSADTRGNAKVVLGRLNWVLP
jgi:von Willebrand factor type A domain